MSGRFRSRLTYSNTVATVALFLAVGGTSYAALSLPAKSVGTKQLKNRAVTLLKISPAARKALHGARGPQGPLGTQGVSGKDGAQGVPGKDGAQGVPGKDGAQGVPGKDGAQGVPGKDGAQGIQGIQGPPGPTSGSSQGEDPFATPNLAQDDFGVNVPATGHLLVMAQWQDLTNGCSSANTANCDVTYGLYLDGQPIPGSAHTILVNKNTTVTSNWNFAAVVPVTAGSHTLEVSGVDSNGTTLNTFGGGNVGMQAVQLG